MFSFGYFSSETIEYIYTNLVLDKLANSFILVIMGRFSCILIYEIISPMKS